jgi:hypothetical protein
MKPKTIDKYKSKLEKSVGVLLQKYEKDYLLWVFRTKSKSKHEILSFDLVEEESRALKMFKILKDYESQGVSILETLRKIESEVTYIEEMHGKSKSSIKAY